MTLFQALLGISLLLTSLVAGFLFAFEVIVMPGLARMADHEYLKAFKAMDGIIQNNHPLFMLVWVGSVLSLLVTTVMSFWYLESTSLYLLIASCGLYILGVQVPTATINVPLNNHLKAQDLSRMDNSEKSELRKRFETGWMRSNRFRSVVSVIVTGLLIAAAIKF